ncbi:MAG: hypothetical protein ACRC92_26555 [Peptostreptococcaceae bacterium]
MVSTKEGFVVSCKVVKNNTEHTVYVMSSVLEKKLHLTSDIQEAKMYYHNARHKMIALCLQQFRNGVTLHGRRHEMFGGYVDKFMSSFEIVSVERTIKIKKQEE